MPVDGRSHRSTWRPTVAMSLGTVLNPLNSSMIAVALVVLGTDFRVSLASVTWVVSGFYLAAAASQPLLGRIADLLGPRRVFVAGMSLVMVVGAAAPFAPDFPILVGFRVLQALGTSAAYPAAMAMLRIMHGGSRGGARRGLTAVATANTLGAAIGPVLGGLLVALAGWQSLFWINVPLALAAAVAALLWGPPDPAWRPVTMSGLLAELDPPGVLLFAAGLVALLGFLLSLAGGGGLWLLPVAVVLIAAFVGWELRTARPFIDLRVLVSNRSLVRTYAQFAAFNLAYYCAFYGLPEWLESDRGYRADQVGLLVLPIALFGAILTPVASRMIARRGVRTALILGSGVLLLGSGSLLLVGSHTAIALVPVACALLGVPFAFNNLGLQSAMYAAASAEQTGMAAGLFQTSRYLGAILSSSVLGVLFAGRIGAAQLHQVGYLMIAVSAVLCVVSVTARRGS